MILKGIFRPGATFVCYLDTCRADNSHMARWYAVGQIFRWRNLNSCYRYYYTSDFPEITEYWASSYTVL